MKKKLLSLMIAGAVAAPMLTACGSDYDAERERALLADIEKEAARDTSKQLNKEKQELAAFVEELKEEDPSVSHAYYSNENGERQLNIVRENSDGDMVTDMLLGAVAGAMLANMMNSKGHSNYYRSQPNYRQPTTMTKEEEKKRRSAGTAGYVSHSKAAATSRIKSNPSRMNTIKQGAFSRVASARSAGYSAGS